MSFNINDYIRDYSACVSEHIDEYSPRSGIRSWANRSVYRIANEIQNIISSLERELLKYRQQNGMFWSTEEHQVYINQKCELENREKAALIAHKADVNKMKKQLDPDFLLSIAIEDRQNAEMIVNNWNINYSVYNNHYSDYMWIVDEDKDIAE